MRKQKINVGILFGGKSAEHEVSLQSAKNIFEALNKNKYHPILIKIEKTGQWFLNDNFKKNIAPIALIPQSNGQVLNLTTKKITASIDVIFPILHGPFGEDGTVQGLLKLANLPFVGSGVIGSAIGMDKDVMKRLLKENKIPIGKFIVLNSHKNIPEFKKIKRHLGLPFFIKPANMGSSVGVNKIHNQTEYLKSLKQAFEYDTKIIIEEYIKGREIECSVLGNHKPIASLPGEIIPTHDFYSYESKYLDEQGAIFKIPAQLSNKTIKKIQALAIKTFATLSGEGLARVDFFLKKNGTILVNEINTMPGFTKISMYPKLWETSGLSYSSLIDKLIGLAQERFDKEKNIKTSFV